MYQQLLLVWTVALRLTFSFPEQTRWTDKFFLDADAVVTKWYHATLFNDTKVRVKLLCNAFGGKDDDMSIVVKWLIRSSPCSGDYIASDEEEAKALISNQDNLFSNEEYSSYAISEKDGKTETQWTYQCGVPVHWDLKGFHPYGVKLDKDGSYKSEALELETEESKKSEDDQDLLGKTWVDGPFMFIIQVSLAPGSRGKAKISLDVEFKGPHGYLSAIDEPLVSFYAIMCFVYCFFAIVWTVFCFLHWRDLLRVQYWICAVIALGLIEKAVFLAEYQHMNEKGEVLKFAEMLAEVVSVFKRTLARILVIIVSLGFGIVRPRLGDVMKQVLAAGFAFFIFASFEAGLRVYQERDSRANTVLFAAVPLSVTDAIICYWIMSNLLQTLKNLKLRRNVVKLTLYRHFFNILAFCVVAALAYIVWSFVTHKLPDCFTDWREIWIDQAYWHVLFSLILAGIIVLWRPSQNNQRYAFSPLMDKPEEDQPEEDDPDRERLMQSDGGLSDNVHIRSIYKSNFKAALATHDPTEDENLKWVEEHIPTAGVDAALPDTLADSDEEQQKTKQEMNKMQ